MRLVKKESHYITMHGQQNIKKFQHTFYEHNTPNGDTTIMHSDLPLSSAATRG